MCNVSFLPAEFFNKPTEAILFVKLFGQKLKYIFG